MAAAPLLVRLSNVSIRPFRRPSSALFPTGTSWGATDPSVLTGATWEINEGEHWVIRGPNGSGKSTLMSALTGCAMITKGNLKFFGPLEDINFRQSEGIRHVSFEHQREKFARDAELELVSNSIGRYYQAPPVIPEKAFENSGLREYLERLGVSSDIHSRGAFSLSTGELNKCLVARAIADAPKLLLLDEVHNGLDCMARVALNEILEEISQIRNCDQTLKTQIVMICHNAAEIPSLITHALNVDGNMLSVEGYNNCAPPPRSSSSTHRSHLKYFSGNSPPSIPPEKDENEKRTTLIEMRNVNIHYGARAVLQDLNWTVKEGEHWAITGPNGSGKSTILELIYGHHPQGFSNDVVVLGRSRKRSADVGAAHSCDHSENKSWNLFEIRKRIGKMDPKLQMRYNRSETSREVILSGYFGTIGLFDTCTQEQIREVDNILTLLNLEDLADTPFNELSLGQQARVLIARAVVNKPNILILDEPCAALDMQSRSVLHEVIDRIADRGDQSEIGHRHQTTVLYVTHHEESTPACVTNVLRLKRNS